VKRMVADNLPFPPLPAQKAGLLSLDCPWHHESRAAVKNPEIIRSPQRHYATADLDHLATIPVREMCLPDAWVMLWITGPHLAVGAHTFLFKKWGVRPSAMGFVWIKLRDAFDASSLLTTPLLDRDLAFGMGFTTRQNAEFCMLGRIGSPRRARADIRQVIISNRREHSRKPEEFYRRAEHFCTGPRIDAFGGAPREGWQLWNWGHRDGEAAPYEPQE
jgi:N6-adenosine-specific RNA methylase IME4